MTTRRLSLGATTLLSAATLWYLAAPPGPVGTAEANTIAAPCDVAPRPLDEVVRLVGTPAPGGGEVEGEVVPTTIPRGRPADEATAGSVIAALQELVTCGNAGDTLRIFALYSDDLLRRLPPIPESAFASPATPEPAQDLVSLDGVLWVEVLDDGRVAAVVVLGGRSDDDAVPGRTVMFVMIEEGHRWFVDDVIDTVAVGDEFVDLGPFLGSPTPEASPAA